MPQAIFHHSVCVNIFLYYAAHIRAGTKDTDWEQGVFYMREVGRLTNQTESLECVMGFLRE